MGDRAPPAQWSEQNPAAPPPPPPPAPPASAPAPPHHLQWGSVAHRIRHAERDSVDQQAIIIGLLTFCVILVIISGWIPSLSFWIKGVAGVVATGTCGYWFYTHRKALAEKKAAAGQAAQ